ncbi:RNA polymerase sigma-70 factor, ECF subfamily [Dyadobacter soli]|uniref:RNA polymerase sigma-70 factor, ECF subfamily n=1 Tax=Dyadobacter soli TaxID=659014 RepID=A0A1G7GEC1_9BACT|nr:sigma-70 family RNA polymerase sigma factor [Dyadobacter soli]SDE86359.1 RNA polymerase sigma-70 factor, ECF subfamily [Dyadobacter soli]
MIPDQSFQPGDKIFLKERTREHAEQPPADSELFIRKAFEEDPDAGVILLFRNYYLKLCSHAARFVSSREIAEDIVSDIFLEFQVKNLHKTVNTSFRAYLYTSVRNRAFDYLRSELLRGDPLDEQSGEIPASVAFDPESITQYEELYHDVEHAVQSLPLKRRQVYLKHRFEGKKYVEIAEELGIPVRSVETLSYQATQEVRRLLRNKWLFLWLLLCFQRLF